MRNNKLDMTAVYRSQNIYASHLGNIIALRELQKQLSIKLNVEIGKVELIALSAHIYENDYHKANEILNNIKKET